VKQRYLLIGKGPDFLTINLERAQQRIASAQRDAKQRVKSTDIDKCAAAGDADPIHVVVGNVAYVDDILSGDDLG
jgi:hypothetical protein